jgi:antitoxin (DNA-binding transcriptional repressor) of toxin-antitoxin stability system
LKGGTPVLIVDRGRPVARLEPVMTGTEAGDEGRLAQLIREGVVRPPRKPVDLSLFTEKPPRPKRGASALAALLEERRNGR